MTKLLTKQAENGLQLRSSKNGSVSWMTVIDEATTCSPTCPNIAMAYLVTNLTNPSLVEFYILITYLLIDFQMDIGTC